MENIRQTSFVLLLALLNFVLLGCGRQNQNPKSLQSIDSSYVEPEDGNNVLQRSNAVNFVHRLVRKEFSSNAKFEKKSLSIIQLQDNRYKIIQSFVVDGDSYNGHFRYDIQAQQFDDGSWEYGLLEIKDEQGLRVFMGLGDMFVRDKKESNTSCEDPRSIEYHIAERKGLTFVRIYTDKRLTISEINEIYKELSGFDRVDLCISERHARGEEYGSIFQGCFLDYTNNDIIQLEK